MLTTSNQIYRLREQGLAAEEKRVRNTYAPALIVILGATVAVSTFLSLRKEDDLRTLLITAALGGVFLAYLAISIPRKALKRLRKCWETYELEVGPNFLVRRQADYPDLKLQFDEIQRIEHVPGRYLRLIGSSPTNVIGIPESIESFDHIRTVVSTFTKVETSRTDQAKKSIAITAVGLAAFLSLMWVNTPLIVVPLGALLICGCLGVLVRYRRSCNIPRSQRRRVMLMYVFIALICFMKVVTVLQSMHR